MTRPLISILTPVLNRIDLIGGALDSVRHAARGVPSEHLVIDAGSTDGTLSLLRSRPDVRLIEAPGTGIYDALNLGLRAAHGEIICQLNSDDLLSTGALEAVAEAYAGPGREADAIRGHALFFADDPEQGASAATLTAEFPVPLCPQDIALGFPAINALFVRRRLYDRVGYFDPRFRLAADREWLLRAFAAGIRVHQICACVYCFRLHTGSLTIDPGRCRSGW
jgi:glycosyltransferase involved in cell wall biosynthesis